MNGSNQLTATGTASLSAPYFIATSTTATSQLLGQLTIGPDGADGKTGISMSSTSPSFYQGLSIQNYGLGAKASADLSICNDKAVRGTACGTYFLNMGINSSNNTDTANFPFLSAGQAYILSSDQSLWNGTSSTTAPNASSTYQIGTAGVTRVTVMGTGSVGIGTTSPSSLFALGVQGDELLSGNLSVANITATGTVTLSGTGSVLSLPSTGWITQNSAMFAYSSTTNQDTVFGAFAGGNVSTTSATVAKNTAIGYQSMYLAGSGANNTAVGHQTMFRLTSGGQNAALGTGALPNLTTGNQNTAIGYFAGLTIGGGSNNTCLGTFTCDLVSTGGQNTFIGEATGSTTATGNGNIAIGYDIALPVNNGSSQLDIGNIIFGTGVNSESSSTPAGLIGIGTSTPAMTFSVQGNGLYSGNLSMANLIATGTGKFLGNVGIGTSSPTTLFSLGLQGNALFSGNLSLANLIATGTLTVTGTATSSFSSPLSFTSASTTATSTMAGINLPYGGCVAIAGVCLSTSGGGGSGTVGTGIAGELPWYSANGTTLSASSSGSLTIGSFFGTSTIASSFLYASTTAFTSTGAAFLATLNSLVGIGTTTAPIVGLTIGSGSIFIPENVMATSTSMSVGIASSTQQLIRYGTSATTLTMSTYQAFPGMKTTVITCNPNATGGAITWANLHYAGGIQPGNTTAANTCDAWFILNTGSTSTPVFFLTGMSPGFQ